MLFRSPTFTGTSVYSQEGAAFNSIFNLYSLVPGDTKNLFFKYNIKGTGSAYFASNAFSGSGYFLGLALCLGNTYVTSSNVYSLLSVTASNYNSYYSIRFNPDPLSSAGSQNTVNYEIDTSLLPLKAGDRVRVFASQFKDDQGNWKYLDDKDLMFFTDLIDLSSNTYAIQRGLQSYDRKIESIEFVQPSIYTPQFGT